MKQGQPRQGDVIATRWSTRADGWGLAEAHGAAWRYAYSGIIPGVTLERMISRRGPAWWDRMHERGYRALVLDCGDTVSGYATMGWNRSPGPQRSGEIYELYLRPEYHGCGLGRRLFDEARRELAGNGVGHLLVWALAENDLACRFYRAMGGAESRRLQERFCGVPLDKIGYTWG